MRHTERLKMAYLLQIASDERGRCPFAEMILDCGSRNEELAKTRELLEHALRTLSVMQARLPSSQK